MDTLLVSNHANRMRGNKRYSELIKPTRRRKSSRNRRSLTEEAFSDYGRVLYSPAFRRLQLKTQVFPLEDNASVRSRLTHSLEVAHIGKRIASRIVADGLVPPKLAEAFVTLTQTACLCHDLGNPPFGHFGETAIQDWFAARSSEIQTLVAPADLSEFTAQFLPDFTRFDGNPQAIRIITRLARATDRYGLNLTASQIAAALKYTPPASATNRKLDFAKKPGYFYSEKSIIQFTRQTLRLGDNARHPASLVMEAADDIAYCMSDIEDSIEKRLTDGPRFLKALRGRGNRLARGNDDLSRALKAGTFLEFKVAFSELAIRRAAEIYRQQHRAILDGTLRQPLLKHDKAFSAFQEMLKEYCQEHIYTAPEAERLELVGHKVIREILSELFPLAKCSEADFLAADGERSLLRRLKNLLPTKHKQAYRETIEDVALANSSISNKTVELYSRLHLLVDFVSGMTDRYAIEIHRTLMGHATGGRS
jgi:dGTPase